MGKNDAVVEELMAKIEDQKKLLGKRPKATLETNGIFKFQGGEFFNINVVTDVSKLVSALAFLLFQEKYFSEAEKALNVKATPFKWDGYSVSDWQSDFQTRIDILTFEAKKKLLDENLKKLESFVSEEKRTEKELDKIKALLGD